MVVVTGRRKEALDETVKKAAGMPGSALAVTADVTNEESVAALFAATTEAFGRVDGA